MRTLVDKSEKMIELALEMKATSAHQTDCLNMIVKRMIDLYYRKKSEGDFIISDELANILFSAGIRIKDRDWQEEFNHAPGRTTIQNIEPQSKE